MSKQILVNIAKNKNTDRYLQTKIWPLNLNC